jgi:hypothetical protein
MASIVVLAACVPLTPENGNGAPGAPLAAPGGNGASPQGPLQSDAVSTASSSSTNSSSALNGTRNGNAKDRAPDVVVGAAPGYHVTLRLSAPPQVCDYDAFADGVRYGYASTWNGLVGALPGVDGDAAAPAPAPAPAKPMFDPASVHPRDAQYKLHWDGGDQPSNACAAYGYLIGKAMGTHRAYADAKAPAGG